MAYGTKYQLNFKDTSNNSYVLYIKERDYVGVITEIIGSENPVIINYTSSDKFSTITPSGLEINLISQTDRQFIDLYTNDYLKYQVILGFYTEYEVFIETFKGFLNTEMYSEDFSQSFNYDVQFTANDGFKILERMSYLDSNGDKYTGIQSHINIIRNILSKLYDEYTIRTVLTTKLSGEILPNLKTILDISYTDNSNFYDEDGEPMSCKDVLEAILKPYGANIRQSTNFYTFDIIDYTGIQTNNTYNEIVYNENSSDGYSIYNFSNNVVYYNKSNLYETGIDYSYDAGVNKQIVSYSPYNMIIILNNEINNETINFTSYVNTEIVGDSEYGFNQFFYSEDENINRYNGYLSTANFAKAVPTGSEVETSATQYYMYMDFVFSDGYINSTSKLFDFKLNNTINVNKSDNYYLKIKCEAYFRNSNRYNGDSNSSRNKYFKRGLLRYRLKIGDNYISPTGSLSDYSTSYFLFFYLKDKADYICDKWVVNQKQDDSIVSETPDYTNEGGIMIPLNNITNGNISFEIVEGAQIYGDSGGDYAYAMQNGYLKDIRLRNIKLSICDENGNDIVNDDIEYVGLLDEKWMNSNENIELIVGCNIDEKPTQRGAILDSGGTYLTQFERSGQTGTIEELLLNSYVSNFETNKIRLKIKYKNGYHMSFIHINEVFLFPTLLPNKFFFISSVSYNLSDGYGDFELIEIEKDKLNIV